MRTYREISDLSLKAVGSLLLAGLIIAEPIEKSFTSMGRIILTGIVLYLLVASIIWINENYK